MKFAWLITMASVLWLGVFTSAVFSGQEDAAALDKRTRELPLPGKVFLVEGRPAFIIAPEKHDQTSPIPWVWYAPTLPDKPDVEEKWMFERFVKAGIAVCGIDVGESYGNPEGRKLFTALHRELVKNHNMAAKPCLLARSRGGLMLLNWAAEHPENVACFAGIYPVTNLRAWPGLEIASKAYGLTAAELDKQLDRHNPNDRLEPLAKARVPMFIIHGDSDDLVPLQTTSAELKRRYEALGGSVDLDIPKGQGHNMWEGFFQCQALVNFVIQHAANAEDAGASLERQFRELPLESLRLTGPLFWLHGDESKDRLEMYVEKVAEGGNGCFTAESRPHNDWLGEGWYRDLAICLKAAKKHNLEMWIFDEKWWPSQGVAGMVPMRYRSKRMEAAAADAEGPREFTADGYGGEKYIAALAGRVAADGKIEGDSLVDLAPNIRDGKLAWKVPTGKWKIIKFTYVQNAEFVDGASKDCVDWFLKTVYQPHYDRFKDDFGKTIRGYFYDEPETRGDWGTELNATLADWKVDWKKAYVAHKFELSGEEQTAAKFQYLDAFAETWGRTMYGGMTDWCHKHGVKSIGHFMEHGNLYVHPEFCAGDMMRLQKFSDMGAIDAVFSQFAIGKRVTYDAPTWQTPKLGSSISHVFGKPDDVTMVEIFGARGQDLTYSEMKWWSNHMQVSGVNFTIPHSFNPRSPYDTDCPPYFYNGGFEPRWPLYRVYADYSSRLTLLLTGGRHVCPVALLFNGNVRQVGKVVGPEGMSAALQDAQYDCDWLPFEVFERDASLDGKHIKLFQERYQVLIVPPTEVIPYATLAKAKEFFDRGGIVIGYGFLPSKSATLGKTASDISSLCREIWGEGPKTGLTACKTNTAGGRAYLLPKVPKAEEIASSLADAGVHSAMEVLEGKTDGWLHVLHRQKAGRDFFLVCNQNADNAARRFKFRATAQGEPECWDAMHNTITSVPFQRIDENTVELSLTLEPSETILLVFQPTKIARPPRIDSDSKPIREPIAIVRDPNPPIAPLVPDPKGRPLTLSPVKAADPFRGRVTIPADVDLASCRVFLEMEDLPDNAAAVTMNGKHAGGVIGKPTRVDITRHVKPGENSVSIEPLAPKSAKIVFYP